jgi:hypothetical protein
MDTFRIARDPGTIQALGDIPVGLAILLVSGGSRLLPLLSRQARSVKSAISCFSNTDE